MKHRSRLMITAVCLTVFFTAAQPARPLAASAPAAETLQAGQETGEQETVTEETPATEEEGTLEAQEEWPGEPSIEAPSGVLMEASTGTVLYDKNMHEQHYPASITKIMTALLAIENCDMDEMVTVPHEAVYMEDKGSHIALDEGEELTVEDCLYAILLASANDAAYSLAVHIGGTIEGFADMMNERARELGCQDTHFTNPHGLPDENHVTSAYDMALITREALKHDIFCEISGTVFYEIQPSDKQPDLIPMSHHHAMLQAGTYHYDGAFAGKNGYTTVAQNTLVTCAERDGMVLISVTMETQGKQVYVDAATLFDYGFGQFKKVDIGQNTETMAMIHARTGGKESAAPETAQVSVLPEEDGYVVLPQSVTLGQLQPDLYYDTENASEGASATLEYTYAGRTVGGAKIALPSSLTVPEETEEEPPAEPLPEKEPEKKEVGLGWLYPVLGILAAAVLAGGIFLFIRRQVWKFRWRSRRRGRKDQVYRRHVRRDTIYQVQARRRRWRRR